MYPVISKAIDLSNATDNEPIHIDFGRLKFIEPVGVVILSNLIEYLNRKNIRCEFSGLFLTNEANVYLDDSGFFRKYLGSPLRAHAASRPSCLPLTMVSNVQAVGYLNFTLIPWLANRLKVSEQALATISVCLDEVFSNINYHSGVDYGCLHIQDFHKTREIQIAISDFGTGIPFNVRKIEPSASDSIALKLAAKEGFTTQSNVKNRGAGLATLIRYLTTKDRGKVWLVSGRANLSAVHDKTNGSSKITARPTLGPYPGTLVRLTLKQDSIADFAADVETEEFSW